MATKRFNSTLERTVQAIVDSILTDRKGGYIWWLTLSSKERKLMQKKWKRFMYQLVLPKEFFQAIYIDLVDEKGFPKTDSKVYKYIKKNWFKGNTKRTLQFLADCKENE